MTRFAKTVLAVAIFGIGSAVAVEAAVPGSHLRGSNPSATQKSATETAEVTALRPAFTLLYTADHDYDGHRAKAMVAIAEACRLMGTDIVPPGARERLEAAGSGTKPAGTKPAAGSKPAKEVKHSSTEPEAQSTSDAQLKQALTIVQQVHDGIPSGKQPRVVEHLDHAITEINQALAVK